MVSAVIICLLVINCAIIVSKTAVFLVRFPNFRNHFYCNATVFMKIGVKIFQKLFSFVRLKRVIYKCN